MITRESEVMLFTHNDLDGIGCEILGRMAFDNIDVTIVKNPKDASQKVKEFLEADSHIFYNKVFITDISVNKEVADMIEKYASDSFVLLDHHGTADFLNEYPWANVKVNGSLGKEAGTSLFFDYLMANKFFKGEKYEDALTVFVEKVRRYDTWEWKDIYNDNNALNLNTLFWLIRRDSFVSRFVERFNNLPFLSVSEGDWLEMFNEVDQTVLKLDDEKKEAYIRLKQDQMRCISLFGNHVGVVYADQYTSELGNVLSEMNPDLKYIAMIDMGAKKVSLRTIHDDIDLGKEVASRFGGGGHAKASGFEFGEDISTLSTFLVASSTKPSVAKHMSNIKNGTGLIGKLSKFVDMFSKK